MREEMKVIHSVSEWKKLVSHGPLRHADIAVSLGFVPTMGYLHEGHLSLIERSRQENDFTAVSIFINPAQFNESSDLQNYPKDLNRDLDLLRRAGVDYVFLPEVEELYPDDFRYKVTENGLSEHLCGSDRPGHFDGVLTVVLKLLLITQATRAYFGEKDFQQYLLVKEMVAAFFVETEILPCPTVRTSQGLALSSRNALLTETEFDLALRFPEVLKTASSADGARRELAQGGLKVDYVEERDGRRFGAVRVGKVRLIDNVQIDRVEIES